MLWAAAADVIVLLERVLLLLFSVAEKIFVEVEFALVLVFVFVVAFATVELLLFSFVDACLLILRNLECRICTSVFVFGFKICTHSVHSFRIVSWEYSCRNFFNFSLSSVHGYLLTNC